MKTKAFAKVFIVCFFAVTGCMNHRFSAVPKVKDVGLTIRTKNRYTLTDFYIGASATSVEGNGFMEMKSEMERSFPEVFGEGGIPFVLRDNGFRDISSNDYLWTVLVYMFSFATLPGIDGYKKTGFFVVEFPKRQENVSLEIRSTWDQARTIFSPVAWLVLNDPPETEGHRSFCTFRSTTMLDELDENAIARDWFWGECLSDIERKAVAYGIAQQLQELENAGRVEEGDETDDSKEYQSYRVVSLSRETDKRFSYRFTLELDANIVNPLQASRKIQQDFQKALREDYVETSPGTAMQSLVVDFPEYRLDDRRIDGRAVVLTIEVISLSYDPNTRLGRISVRFVPNQYEEARQWARKNIETLARDKNIPLTTGTLPPEATYYSLGEKIEGNVMEIEFRTE